MMVPGRPAKILLIDSNVYFSNGLGDGDCTRFDDSFKPILALFAWESRELAMCNWRAGGLGGRRISKSGTMLPLGVRSKMEERAVDEF